MQNIGKYRILGEIGAGSMGVVYKALDPMERVVAVKTMSARIDADPHLRERFFREARAAAQLSHRNIVTIYYMDEDGGKVYLAMEFLEGKDLRSVLSTRQPLTLEWRIDVMLQICSGLSHAHSKGVVHRDIKPGNLFITQSGDVKILDFGLARFVTAEFTASSESMGTPGYMSPEQLQSSRVDHRSDIYSVGVVFYEMLTYCRAFEADSLPALFFKIIYSDPEPIERFEVRIPSELSAIIRRSMARNPDDRYQQIDEMIKDLQQLRTLLEERKTRMNEETGEIFDKLKRMVRDNEGLLEDSGFEPEGHLQDDLAALRKFGSEDSFQVMGIDYYKSWDLCQEARSDLQRMQAFVQKRMPDGASRLETCGNSESAVETIPDKAVAAVPGAEDMLELESGIDHGEASQAKERKQQAVPPDRPEKLEPQEKSRPEPEAEEAQKRPAAAPVPAGIRTRHDAEVRFRPPEKRPPAHAPKIMLALGGAALLLFLFWQFLFRANPSKPAPDQASDRIGTEVQVPQRPAGSEIQRRIADLMTEAGNLRDQASRASGEERMQRLRAASSKARSALELNPSQESAKSLANEIEQEIRKIQDGMTVVEQGNVLNEGLKRAAAEMKAGNLQEAKAQIDQLKRLRPNDSSVVATEKHYWDLMSTPLAYRNWVGLNIAHVTDQDALESGLGKPRGGLVAGVAKGGPAEKAGLQVKDIILEVDQTAVSFGLLVPRLVGTKMPGESIHIKVWRQRQAIDINIIAGPVPESVRKERAAAAEAQLETEARRERLLQCTAKYCPVCEDPRVILAIMSDECLKCSDRYAKQIEQCVAQTDQSRDQMEQAKQEMGDAHLYGAGENHKEIVPLFPLQND